jgi:hypothetical protein
MGNDISKCPEPKCAELLQVRRFISQVPFDIKCSLTQYGTDIFSSQVVLKKSWYFDVAGKIGDFVVTIGEKKRQIFTADHFTTFGTYVIETYEDRVNIVLKDEKNILAPEQLS